MRAHRPATAGPPTGARDFFKSSTRLGDTRIVPTTSSADHASDPRLVLGAAAGSGEQRPWGAFVILDDGPMGKVKRITVDPGQQLSYQLHHRRKEHWFVVAGRAVVTLDGVEHEVLPGEAIDIPLETAHRVRNPGDEALVFVEVQQGDYFGEDDIVRLEDDYGRAG
jgi:mannose-6-phosphate isomerase